MYVCAVQRTYVCTYVRAYMHNMCICTLHICICMYVHTLFIIALTVGRIEVLNLPLYVFTTIGITANTLWFYYLLLGATYVHAYMRMFPRLYSLCMQVSTRHEHIRTYVCTYLIPSLMHSIVGTTVVMYVRTYIPMHVYVHTCIYICSEAAVARTT